MKVLIVPHADYYVMPAEELRAEYPDLTFVEPQTDAERLREVVDTDAFFGTPTSDEMRAAKRLRWIHNPGMGIDRLTLVPEIVASDVVITNAPGPHTNPMADHAFMFILALAHSLVETLDDQRQRVWDTVKYNGRMLPINGSRLGILSMGGIGRAVVQRALGFGMQVYAMDPSPTDVPAGVRTVYPPERLDEMLRHTDWLVVTSPFIPATRNLINAERMALMPKGAHIIVVSRGGIVDEDALAAALHSGHIAGAGLDATATEPLPQDSPLWTAPNLLISPHSSALSTTLAAERQQIFRANLRRFVEGRALAFVCPIGRGY